MYTRKIVFVILLVAVALLVVLGIFKEQKVVTLIPDQVEYVSSEVNDGGVLRLSGEGLTEFPEYVLENKQLQVLDLSENNLEGALPAEIRFLSRLRVLDISHNNFTGIPAEIGQLSNLVELDISYNKLTGLPHEIGNLQKLEVLDIRGNLYSEYDVSIIREVLPVTTEIIVD